jgi:hypothetical protein
MASKDEVEQYLSDLKAKLSVFEMVIIERKKNQETLAELEIVNPKAFCIDEINKLTAKNYFRGPSADTENKGEFWEFGTLISKRQIYIKVNYGLTNKPCILISFHFAEFEMIFPLG